MRKSYWERVVADGYRVPHGAALNDLTTELVSMLGDPDPHVRDDIACSILRTWTDEGVYDELLSGLGDGLLHGLRAGLGEDGTASALRRSLSAMTLAHVVRRDNAVQVLPATSILTWADRSVTWLLAEKDLRGWDPEVGWVQTIAHGADLLGAFAASRYFNRDELNVLLDVIAERLLADTEYRLVSGECDRLAHATMSVLHRNLVTVDALESWLERLSKAWADPPEPGVRESAVRANCVSYARALHLQLLLGVWGTPTQDVMGLPGATPSCRPDLLIALQRALRTSAPAIFRQQPPGPPPRAR
ncbi:MAG TPA: DUF2785 domain-containing protein [Jiangellales bacterium]|nr:DUF2785 domain-containing protein [Jiangellales bacterium]